MRICGEPSDSALELTGEVAFARREAETKLVLPGLTQPNAQFEM